MAYGKTTEHVRAFEISGPAEGMLLPGDTTGPQTQSAVTEVFQAFRFRHGSTLVLFAPRCDSVYLSFSIGLYRKRSAPKEYYGWSFSGELSADFYPKSEYFSDDDPEKIWRIFTDLGETIAGRLNQRIFNVRFGGQIRGYHVGIRLPAAPTE